MAYRIKSNPGGCCNQELRGQQTCLECYHSFLWNNVWHGSKACWDSECLVLDIASRSELDKKRFERLNRR